MGESETVLDKAVRLKLAGTPFALATVVRCESPTSAKPGAKGIITPDGAIDGWIGGGCAQPAVIKTALKCLQDGQPRYIRISPSQPAALAEDVTEFGMACHSGGTLDLFIDPVVPRTALLVLGTSPTAQALTALAARVGFAVTVAFKEATTELFPDAQSVLPTLDAAALKSNRPQFVVVATQGKRDEAALEAALATDASYIAFVASGKKAAKLRAYLKERGHDATRVDAIAAPAGVEIGAVTPEEIALSVLAGVVAARRIPQEAAPASKTAPDIKTARAVRVPIEDPGARPIDPICGMAVDAKAAEHTSRYSGRDFFFCCAHCKHKFDQDPEKYTAQMVSAK